MITRRNFVRVFLLALVLAVLYLSSLYNFLLFHTLAELFSIIVAFAIFVLAWNFRRFYPDSFQPFLGTAYLAFSALDLAHTLAYLRIGIFPGNESNLTSQLWIAARYLQSISLLIAPLFLRRKWPMEWLLAGFGLLTGLLLLAVYSWNVFPEYYIQDSGLTISRIYAGYVVAIILAVALLGLYNARSQIDRTVLRWISLSIGFAIASELTLTLLIDLEGLPVLAGHFFKILSAVMVYKAIFETEAGAIYADMTQLKRTQSALLKSTAELRQRENEAQRSLAELKTIYGTTPVGLCFLDTELRYQAVNEVLANMNGLPVEQHLGKSIREVVTVGVAAQLESYLRQVLDTGRPVVNLEISSRSMPGFPDHRYLLGSFHPALDDGDCLLGISCVIQDFTEQKRAELALESSERTLKLFIEYAPTAIAMLDRQMCYIVASRRYLEDYRLGNQNLAGRSHYEIFPEIPERWKEIHQRCLAGAVEMNDEDMFPRSDGSVDWVRWEIRPWFDHLGTVGGIILFSEVITHRKQAEEELAEAHVALQAYAQKLKRSNQELEQFAFVASHDLQEPLRKIRFFGNNLQQQFAQNLPADARDYLERMQSAAERMRTMIDGLLELSRVSTRGGNFVLVDLTPVVEEAIADLEPRIRTTGGEVILDSLPSAEVDVVQIRQLFQNLIGNALKFHRPGVAPVVRVYQGPVLPGTTISQVDIVVQDNGIGFDEQFTDRIFQPFQRLHGKSEFEGSGLGLAISQKIVERHHGKLKVCSVLNEGSVFTVTLPIRQSISLRAGLPD